MPFHVKLLPNTDLNSIVKSWCLTFVQLDFDFVGSKILRLDGVFCVTVDRWKVINQFMNTFLL